MTPGAGGPGGAASDRRPRRVRVEVASLRRRTGDRRALVGSVELDEMVVTAAHVPGDRVDVELELVSVPEGVVVEGTLVVDWSGECRRCLGEVRGRSEVAVREIFEVEPTEGETWPLGDEFVDLAPMLHDLALGVLPLAPLCSDTCAGPDPERFPARPASDGEAVADADAPRDPRWAALDGLVFADDPAPAGRDEGATDPGGR